MAEKPKTAATGDGDIRHPEIWREILIRLPVKPILRCRSVCKSWYSLISCPNFISDHSARDLNKNDNNALLQLWDNRSEVWSFSSLDDSFMESIEHDYVSQPVHWENIEIVGSCNGLICLCTYGPATFPRITFLIWNPAIRKLVELPSRPYTKYVSYFGFGFDSNTNDFKVLCIVDVNVCEIFDLRIGLWRGISPTMLHSCNVGRPYPECYVNGAVHWSGRRHRHGEIFDKIILSFNMSDECFREIRMPDGAEFTEHGNYDDIDLSIGSVAFGGLLYVKVWKMGWNEPVDVSESCSIWAMKEYGVTESWTKVYDIDLQSAQVLPRTKLWLEHFCIWNNGEVLMVHDHLVEEPRRRNQTLVLYNTDSKESKHLFSTTKRVRNLYLFKESLFLMCGNG